MKKLSIMIINKMESYLSFKYGWTKIHKTLNMVSPSVASIMPDICISNNIINMITFPRYKIFFIEGQV